MCPQLEVASAAAMAGGQPLAAAAIHRLDGLDDRVREGVDASASLAPAAPQPLAMAAASTSAIRTKSVHCSDTVHSTRGLLTTCDTQQSLAQVSEVMGR